MPIVAMGGYPDERLRRHLVGLVAKGAPSLLFVGTASMESPELGRAIDEAFRGLAEVTHLEFAPWPPSDVRGLTLRQDIVLVGGGNTANMLAIWRVHGFDSVLREARENGVFLAGWSAGAICWFEAGVTDSFGPQLEGMRDGLGFVQGSACPHYDGEELRRPRYTELVRGGFPSGIAIDDDVAVRFDRDDVTNVVSSRAGASAYRVTPDGEETLEARLLA